MLRISLLPFAPRASKYDVAGLGEMGIGNTTAAAAVLAFYAQCDPAEIAGPGTGLDPAAVAHKANVIRAHSRYINLLKASRALRL